MKATLNNLLTVEEISEIVRHPSIFLDLNSEFQNLTLKELRSISFIILRSKYDKIPESSVVTSLALEEITQRAINFKIPLYT